MDFGWKKNNLWEMDNGHVWKWMDFCCEKHNSGELDNGHVGKRMDLCGGKRISFSASMESGKI